MIFFLNEKNGTEVDFFIENGSLLDLSKGVFYYAGFSYTISSRCLVNFMDFAGFYSFISS